MSNRRSAGSFRERHPFYNKARPIFFLRYWNVASADPKSVKVHLQAGTGVEIEWGDGHRSKYPFPYLRDACPCALCDEERNKSGRRAGEAVKSKPGELPMFKESAKPLSAEPVGKYALKFNWNDGHQLGIYSWKWLREICPCADCRRAG
jgi:DUF971 family protein